MSGVAIALLWLAWAVWIWPRIVISQDRIVVRNTFSTTEIPFSDVADVRSGLTLVIALRSGKRVNVYAVGGTSNLGFEAGRQAHAHASGPIPVRRVEDLALRGGLTQASRVSQIIQRRIEQAGGADSSSVAARSMNVWMLVGTVVAIVAGVAGGVATQL